MNDDNQTDAVAEMMRQAGVAPASPGTADATATASTARVPPPAPTQASAPTRTKEDSLAPDYLAHSQAISMQSAIESMRRLAAGGDSSPAPATPTPDETSDSKTLLPDVKQQMIYDPDKGAYVPDPNYKNYQPDILGRVATDVAKGTLEAPLVAVRGARDAVQSMLDGVDSFNSWWVHKAGLQDALHFDQTKPWQLPEAGHDASTVSGSLVQSTAQFLTGMGAVGKVLGGGIPATVKGAAAMFSAFEGKGDDLSNLIQNTPLANPVNEFLAAKPDDSEAVGRLKKAVEGVGIGKLADGLVGAIRMIKGADAGQAAIGPAIDEGARPGEINIPGQKPGDVPGPSESAQPKTTTAQAPQGEGAPAAPSSGIRVNDNAFKTLGDPTAPPGAPLVSKGQATKQAAAETATAGQGLEAVAGATAETPININFARIDTPDDVKTAMQQMVNAQAGNIDAARRGVQSFEDTQLGADSTNAWNTLMERRQGQPLNAEEMLAGRQLWQQSAVKTQEVMQQALDNPTPENLLAFRKQWTTHAMIQQEVIAARTEVARSLSAMRIPVGGNDADRMSSIVDQIEQAGGLNAQLDFLRKVKGLMDTGDLTSVGNVAEKSIFARTRDQLLNAWTNGLLTNPLTHVKVNLSNAATIALRLTETRVAESVDRLLGNQGGVVAGEAAQTAAGLVQSLKDMFRYVGKVSGLNIDAPAQNPLTDAATAFRTERYGVGKPQSDWGSTFENTLATDTIQMSSTGWVGRAADLAQQVIRTPGRTLTAEHEFYRSIGMRMELNRFAIRQATADLNAGKIGQDDFQGRIAELIEDPPPAILDNAVNGMTYQTFTDAPGKLAETIEKLRNDYPSTRFIIPFYKIPSRMLSFTFERSPLAPLMSSFQQNIAAGGARQSMALAQMGLGSAVMLATADSVFNGSITGQGPLEKGKRLEMQNEGWQPYSIKVGDRWVQYNRLETVGSSMAMAADIAEVLRQYHTAVNADDADTMKLVAAGSLAIANSITSKTYLEGIARFFEAMGNPQQGGQAAALSLAGSAVPAGVGAAARLVDPYNREVNSMTDAIRARIPGVSKGVAVERNVWGEPVSHASGLGKMYDAFLPFATHPAQNEPIDAELERLGMNVTRPPASTSINGVKVNLKEDPEQYSRYVELAGNEAKSPTFGNRGLKDALNDLVTGSLPGFSQIYNMRQDGQDGGKAVMINDMIRQYRELAKTQLVREYPELGQKIEAQRQVQQQLKLIGQQKAQQPGQGALAGLLGR